MTRYKIALHIRLDGDRQRGGGCGDKAVHDSDQLMACGRQNHTCHRSNFKAADATEDIETRWSGSAEMFVYDSLNDARLVSMGLRPYTGSASGGQTCRRS